MEFHRLALEESRRAAAWYRKRSARAAERFVQQIRIAIERVTADPESFPLIGAQFRSIRIGKYPFMLIYEIRSPEVVFVIAIAHTSRRSAYWRRRV